jgi:hypothetical protein
MLMVVRYVQENAVQRHMGSLYTAVKVNVITSSEKPAHQSHYMAI